MFTLLTYGVNKGEAVKRAKKVPEKTTAEIMKHATLHLPDEYEVMLEPRGDAGIPGVPEEIKLVKVSSKTHAASGKTIETFVPEEFVAGLTDDANLERQQYRRGITTWEITYEQMIAMDGWFFTVPDIYGVDDPSGPAGEPAALLRWRPEPGKTRGPKRLYGDEAWVPRTTASITRRRYESVRRNTDSIRFSVDVRQTSEKARDDVPDYIRDEHGEPVVFARVRVTAVRQRETLEAEKIREQRQLDTVLSVPWMTIASAAWVLGYVYSTVYSRRKAYGGKRWVDLDPGVKRELIRSDGRRWRTPSVGFGKGMYPVELHVLPTDVIIREAVRRKRIAPCEGGGWRFL